ncbi:MAG: trypsin-like peptidase domain-containing protein [Bacteroidia bacterium]|nr:trypsin-like peptidase domain-containing protein [Bacteroidia bacterium]
MSRPSSEASSTVTNSQPVVYQRQTVDGVDFIEASKHSTPTVVFIKTEAEVQRRSSFWLFDFDPFGSIGKVSSTGSGVIISEDGYIVTNHHVVKNALKIEVVLNNGKRNYEATVIGTAPSSDLALLKIEAEGLSAIQIANSDEVEIGEWVLAVGNPFNLTSTVTAGIVSAKGRNINLVQNQFPIESFIQTDAAINPGNSGGALVNLNGELVGINTAIASKTGSYVGYGFAIPSNIVVKIINDLKEFGQLQRGFDGLEVVDINDEILDLVDGRQDGVYIARISETNADAGRLFETGDVLVEIDGKAITDKAMYDEVIAYHRPGDELSYVILRDGNRLTKDIKLVNLDGDYELKKRVSHYSEKLRAEFETVSKYELEHFAIESGIRVTKIGNGQLRKMNIPEGFIFTALNKKPATDLKDFVNKLENLRGQIRIEGVSPQGGKQYLSFYAY